MNLELSEEALEFGRQAKRRFESAGGDGLLRAAEVDPELRADLEPVMEKLGCWELDVRAGSEELEAAAALCRSAGYWALPYPVAERLCRPGGLDVDALVVVGQPAEGPVAGLQLRWAAVTLDGHRSLATPRGNPVADRNGAFVARFDLETLDWVGGYEVALGLVLPCWTLLGLLDRVMELTRSYVVDRRQFDQPLAAFQGVQFQLTTAEVERLGLEELAKYSLWSVETRSPDALDDALAFRLAAIEAADTVLRVAHQLHGAIGFCDESTLSWLSRYSIPLRHLPTGLSATRATLARRLDRRALGGLFQRADGPGRVSYGEPRRETDLGR